jgi:ABC-type multidrug transport system fused ATPase/permease subunit
MNIPLKQYWNLLAKYLAAQRSRVVLLAVLLLIGIALDIINPQILRTFIDSATTGGASNSLMLAALLFIGVALVQRSLAISATYVGEGVSWNATNGLRADLALHCLRLDMSFHNLHTPGELIERIDGDVTALSNYFSQFVIRVLGNLVLLLGVLIVLYFQDWRIGLGMTAFAGLALFILVRIRFVAVPHWRRVRQVNAEFYGFIGESLAGTEDIRSSGATDYILYRFYDLMRRWLPLQIKASVIGGSAMWSSILVTFAVGMAVAFALGAWLYHLGAITIGTVYLLFFYTEMIRQPIEQILRQLEDLSRASASIGRIRDLLAIDSKLPVVTHPIDLPRGPLSVDFQNVSFSYADAEPVLHDVTFHLPAGKILGVLGRTGSGKTTLARLLLRLYDPHSGEIKLGSADRSISIRSASEADLRQRVGMVTQDVQLFHASVRDNLTFFDTHIADESVQQKIDQLGLRTRIESMSDGLDTELASGGGGLSAGEAQLLACARLFLRDPGLVILDEASSRLDPATEQLIEQAITQLLTDRTGIVIAHRLKTVQRADNILILDEGRIVEYGDREQLLRDPSSRFYQLMQTGLEEVLA